MGALASSIPRLSQSQAAMVDVIEREFLAAGYSLEVAAAAVVNAYAESGLNPRAVGDNGHSVGLFQLHDRGAGAGMTVAARQDPTTNVRAIITRERAALTSIAAAARSGTPVASLAASFSSMVERPLARAAAEAYRAALAVRLFPIGIRGWPSLGRSTPSATKRSTNAYFLWGAAALASIGILALLLRGRSRTRSTPPPPAAITQIPGA